ncbi:MAG: type II toxin-antitoxin system VapC family toxin [Abditibacteriales bacterium]|nr:type II toxin-antitoxin system VapC family toxin [Abditibacteriales bacterium]MDW8366336.1 type II toxin-antitoxin system VapC family toxin [Abditibacteriales bacterium]
MRTFVVDASIAVKWFLEEVHAESARRLLDDGHALLVPDLFFPEVGNILWKRVRFGEMSEEEAAAMLQALRKIPLQIHPSLPLILPALEIACQIQRTVYDSLYIALAVHERTVMVTADEKFYNAIKGSPLSPHVLWVEDIAQVEESSGSP